MTGVGFGYASMLSILKAMSPVPANSGKTAGRIERLHRVVQRFAGEGLSELKRRRRQHRIRFVRRNSGHLNLVDGQPEIGSDGSETCAGWAAELAGGRRWGLGGGRILGPTPGRSEEQNSR